MCFAERILVPGLFASTSWKFTIYSKFTFHSKVLALQSYIIFNFELAWPIFLTCNRFSDFFIVVSLFVEERQNELKDKHLSKLFMAPLFSCKIGVFVKIHNHCINYAHFKHTKKHLQPPFQCFSYQVLIGKKFFTLSQHYSHIYYIRRSLTVLQYHLCSGGLFLYHYHKLRDGKDTFLILTTESNNNSLWINKDFSASKFAGLKSSRNCPWFLLIVQHTQAARLLNH